MNSGPERCGNCCYFIPIRKVKGHTQASHCSTREHNYYGSLIPGDPMEDKSKEPRQTKLAVATNSNSKGNCDLFEPDYGKIKTWKEEEKKYKERDIKELKG